MKEPVLKETLLSYNCNYRGKIDPNLFPDQLFHYVMWSSGGKYSQTDYVWAYQGHPKAYFDDLCL